MRKIILLSLLICSLQKTQAQSYELQQLLLDVQKLSQLKQILSDMQTGYDVVSKGYTRVRDIASGNFNLHETFLDGLMLISPSVRTYWKMPVIIDDQLNIVKQSQAAIKQYKQSQSFTAQEISYITDVFNNLLKESLQNIEELTTVMSANRLRMSDAERLQAIDRIYAGMKERREFLDGFSKNTSLLDLQRTRDLNDTRMVKQLYKLP